MDPAAAVRTLTARWIGPSTERSDGAHRVAWAAQDESRTGEVMLNHRVSGMGGAKRSLATPGLFNNPLETLGENDKAWWGTRILMTRYTGLSPTWFVLLHTWWLQCRPGHAPEISCMLELPTG